MVAQLVPDTLWAVVQPILPENAPSPRGGRPKLEDRAVLAGIIFVLRCGLPWRALPQQLGFGSGLTCWRRLRDWQQAGVWQKLHQALLQALQDAELLDWSRASVDSTSVPAPKGGLNTGPNPTDRGKCGSKLHLIVDNNRVPIALSLSGANVHDSKKLVDVLNALPKVHDKRFHLLRTRPAKLHADKGYDYPRCRTAVKLRGITPRIARRQVEEKSRLGRNRWKVERTFSWLLNYKKLAVRYGRRSDLFLALGLLASSLVCFRRLHFNF
nr:IS5 family transposase [Deinococcus metalli]